MTPPDRRSTVAFSPSDHLDNIFQAVRHQVERWGENAKWKIELILLSDQQQASSYPSATTTTTPPPSSSKQLLPHHPHHHEQDELNHHRSIKPTYYSQGITRSNNRSETWNIPYAADLQHNLRNALDRIKYLENVIRTQEDRLRQLKQPHTLQMMHTTTVNELKEHHQVEMKLLQKENQTLAKKFMRISSTLQKIERIGLSSEESPSDNTTLLEERKLLLRKLHLGELRLRARDAELNYLHNLVWSFRHPSPTTSDDDDDDEEEEDEEQDGQKEQVDKKKKQNVLDKKTSISSSPSSTTIPSPLFLLQKQYSPRPMSALDSLSILADQMLSDPDFGSEGKESSASPDYGPKTHSSLSSTKKNNNSTTMNDYPSSSVYIKKEMNDMTPSALPKKRRRKEPRQQEQVTVASPPLGYYHHGNIKQYRVVGADEVSI
ncbi:hypothetical protein BDA99DRAFT_541706 [Phascolomyces articulosus]|uniref:Uncharacterized protein n=1 Tax=Phascolomyces articulosus TaxID=60185 RepID=A0AAD5JQZ1_9FUNG|nr:hypothetical protein BDA99DRAFT_541706 [Phascolomyces articulosus]